MLQFKNKDLFGVAFIDSQIYIHQLCAIKNFILVGDVMKSVDLLQFQQDYRTLAVISRDPKPLEVYACEYAVDNNILAFLVTDADKNLVVYVYEPAHPDSQGGQRLILKGDVQMGQHVTSMFRIRAKITDPTTGGRIYTGWEKRHVTWFGTLDGAFGHLLPLAEKHFRRASTLTNLLSTLVPHEAGLNPKASRTLRQRRRELLNPARSIVDGDLLFRFSDLSVAQKFEISSKMGLGSPFELMDDLAEMDRQSSHF